MWKEVVAQFKDEDIDRWPDYAASEAFHLRGKAHDYLKEPKSAAKDMEKALECAGSDAHFRATVLCDLGSVYVSLQDDAKALDAYLKAQSGGDKGFHAYLSAVIARANILRRQGKHEDALRELEKNDLGHLKGYWRCETLRAYGSVLASQGKKADAIARYNEALKVEDIHPSQKSACEKAIKELEAGAK
jgi:tetratricopeptide (TPR) repeat protein